MLENSIDKDHTGYVVCVDLDGKYSLYSTYSNIMITEGLELEVLIKALDGIESCRHKYGYFSDLYKKESPRWELNRFEIESRLKIPIDELYVKMAELVSHNSPCFRSKVGAILVRNASILMAGFNVAPGNQPDCSKIGFCFRDANKIPSGTLPDQCRASGSHAESRAIALAAKNGILTNHAIMYIFGNSEICAACRGAIMNAGIKMVVYKSKTGEIERINVEYDWAIHPLDMKRRFNDWKENYSKPNGKGCKNGKD